MALACVASVSVRFRSKERGTRVKDCAKNGSCFISRVAKTENPVLRSFFPPKPTKTLATQAKTACKVLILDVNNFLAG